MVEKGGGPYPITIGQNLQIQKKRTKKSQTRVNKKRTVNALILVLQTNREEIGSGTVATVGGALKNTYRSKNNDKIVLWRHSRNHEQKEDSPN